MASKEDLESIMFDALKNSNSIAYSLPQQIFGSISKDTIFYLTNSLNEVELLDDGFKAINENGDDIICPNYGVSISNDGRWLSDFIPDPNFDTDMAGNIRKSVEAESAYSCALICGIIKDEYFKKEFEDTCLKYDFDNMKSYNSDGKNFEDLLNEWLDLQSFQINVIVSASKYKIAARKKDTAKFLRDGIPEDLAIELRSLDIKVSNINREYSTGPLSPINVKNLTKVKILTLIDEREEKINKELNSSRANILYRLLNLSTEYVSPVIKRKLSKLAITEVEKYFTKNEGSSEIIGDKQSVIKSWKKRYLKIARLSVRKEQVSKYLADKENFKMPVKQ